MQIQRQNFSPLKKVPILFNCIFDTCDDRIGRQIPIPIKFIRHRGDDSVIPVAIRGLNVSRKNPAEQWDGKRTITFVEALDQGRKRSRWMIVSGGRRPIRVAGRSVFFRGGFARAEEWTSLFSRLWWKRFSRIAVTR